MSNHLAIATVTATLRALLWDTARVVRGAQVLHLGPDDAQKTGLPGINLYLYQVLPNPTLRNQALPWRNPDGSPHSRAPAALDLHYLLTFFGKDEDLEPQRLMGATIRTLQTYPIITRDMMRQVIDAATEPDSPTPWLAASNLDQQVEAVRFTPYPLSLEMISKFWSAFFQVPYALSIAYECSVVMVDGLDTGAIALPARKVRPSILPSLPRQIRVETPAVEVGDTLVLEVRGGVDPDARVQLGAVLLAPDITDDRLSVALTWQVLAQADVAPGVQEVRLVEPSGLASEAVPFSLRPRLTDVRVGTTQVPDSTTDRGTLEVPAIVAEVMPPVPWDTPAEVLLNPIGSGSAYAIGAVRRPGAAAELTFAIDGVPAGTYLVRIRAGGVDSSLAWSDGSGFTGPTVTVGDPDV